MSTEYVTKPEFDLAILGIERRMDSLSTKDAVARIEADTTAIKSNYATKADVSDIKTDVHKALSEQTWRVIAAIAALIAVTTAIQKITLPPSGIAPTSPAYSAPSSPK